MRQEVKIDMQLTLDVDAELSKEDIKKRIAYHIDNLGYNMHVMMIDIHEIREEAEIYGTEE